MEFEIEPPETGVRRIYNRVHIHLCCYCWICCSSVIQHLMHWLRKYSVTAEVTAMEVELFSSGHNVIYFQTRLLVIHSLEPPGPSPVPVAECSVTTEKPDEQPRRSVSDQPVCSRMLEKSSTFMRRSLPRHAKWQTITHSHLREKKGAMLTIEIQTVVCFLLANFHMW